MRIPRAAWSCSGKTECLALDGLICRQSTFSPTREFVNSLYTPTDTQEIDL
jgi:hypothetical protein